MVTEFKVNDQDCRDKYAFVKKTIKEKAFKEAISASERYEMTIDATQIVVEETYTGPKLEDVKKIDLEWFPNKIFLIKGLNIWLIILETRKNFIRNMLLH